MNIIRKVRGQSETIGVVLLAAVVIAVVSISGAFVLTNTNSQADKVLIDAEIEISASQITVSHQGGDTVEREDIKLVIQNGTERRAVRSLGRSQFAPSDTITVSNTYSGSVSIVVIYEPAGSIIREQTERIGGTPAATPPSTPTAKPSPTPTPTATPVPTATPTPTTTPTATPEPANFRLRITGTNSPVQEGDTVQVTVEVTNSGGLQDTQAITASRLFLELIPVSVASQDITLAAGETRTIKLEWTAQDRLFASDTVRIESDDDSATTTVAVE